MFCSKNKIFVFVFLIALSVLFYGCKGNNDYDDSLKITPENIFGQSEDKYYVYFYRDSCPYCEDVFEYVVDYINDDKDIKLYVCDLSDKKQITYKLFFTNNIVYEIITLDNDVVNCDDAIESTKIGNYYIINYPNNIQLKILWKNNKIEFQSDDLQKYEIIKEEVINNEIKRSYNGTDGQGSSGKYYVDGVKKYDDLFIAGVPSLILINEENVSTFITSGRKNIKEFFSNNIKLNSDIT